MELVQQQAQHLMELLVPRSLPRAQALLEPPLQASPSAGPLGPPQRPSLRPLPLQRRQRKQRRLPLLPADPLSLSAVLPPVEGRARMPLLLLLGALQSFPMAHSHQAHQSAQILLFRTPSLC